MGRNLILDNDFANACLESLLHYDCEICSEEYNTFSSKISNYIPIQGNGCFSQCSSL